MANNMKQKPNRAKKRNPKDYGEYDLRKIRRLLKEHGEQLAAIDANQIFILDRLEDLDTRLALAKQGIFTAEPMTKRGRR